MESFWVLIILVGRSELRRDVGKDFLGKEKSMGKCIFCRKYRIYSEDIDGYFNGMRKEKILEKRGFGKMVILIEVFYFFIIRF